MFRAAGVGGPITELGTGRNAAAPRRAIAAPRPGYGRPTDDVRGWRLGAGGMAQDLAFSTCWRRRLKSLGPLCGWPQCVPLDGPEGQLSPAADHVRERRDAGVAQW